MFAAFPSILIAIFVYNLIVFGLMLAGQHQVAGLLGQKFGISMVSGDTWTVSFSDLFVLLGLALLFAEVVKATRTSTREIINHALSMLVFVAALVEFIVLKGFATSTFFFLTLMCLFDVVAGYTISIVAARRDIAAIPADSHGH